jgi:FkbM family methyltransferase
MRKLIDIVKRNKTLYNFILFFYKIYKAILSVKLNIHAIRELKYDLFNKVSLGEKNHVFYNNFFNNLIKDKNLLILDVGANDGWFAKIVFRYAPNLKVISFEPLKSMLPFLEIIKKSNANYSFENIGLGKAEGASTIKEYFTTGLSSLKEINSEYKYDLINFNQEIKDEYKVEIITLDNYIKINSINCNLCLKIDTQGYEMEVLEGAIKLFEDNRIKVVLIELMTLEKYEGAKLYNDIINFLEGFGFRLCDVHTSYYENNGKLSEFDAVFMLN